MRESLANGTVIRWAVKWRSYNRLDGKQEFFVWATMNAPALFYTRAEARAYIRQEYGYIATRDDLRREPHGWRMPIAVRVRLSLSESP